MQKNKLNINSLISLIFKINDKEFQQNNYKYNSV